MWRHMACAQLKWLHVWYVHMYLIARCSADTYCNHSASSNPSLKSCNVKDIINRLKLCISLPPKIQGDRCVKNIRTSINNTKLPAYQHLHPSLLPADEEKFFEHVDCCSNSRASTCSSQGGGWGAWNALLSYNIVVLIFPNSDHGIVLVSQHTTRRDKQIAMREKSTTIAWPKLHKKISQLKYLMDIYCGYQMIRLFCWGQAPRSCWSYVLATLFRSEHRAFIMSYFHFFPVIERLILSHVYCTPSIDHFCSEHQTPHLFIHVFGPLGSDIHVMSLFCSEHWACQYVSHFRVSFCSQQMISDGTDQDFYKRLLSPNLLIEWLLLIHSVTSAISLQISQSIINFPSSLTSRCTSTFSLWFSSCVKRRKL